jgi:hypothetical protein
LSNPHLAKNVSDSIIMAGIAGGFLHGFSELKNEDVK